MTNIISHALGLVLSMVALVLMVIRASLYGNMLQLVSVSIFGVSLIALYTASTFYHSATDVSLRTRLRIIDHATIYVLIAGTYTPVVIATLDGPLRWTVLAIAWGAVLVGAVQHVFFPRDKQTFSMILAVSMGWLGVVIAWRFVQELGWTASGLAILGGAIYTVGMILMVMNRPRLWPRVFSYHEVFHVMVVAASAVHFVLVWRYVLPLG